MIPSSACPQWHILIKQARAEHHGDDQRQLHHSMGQHPAQPKRLIRRSFEGQVLHCRSKVNTLKIIQY
jgi:hypothetical protein